MSAPVLMHLLGVGLVLLLVRLGGGPGDLLTQSSLFGWLLVFGALFLSFRNKPEDDGAISARLWRLRCQVLGMLGLALVTAIALEQLGGFDLASEGQMRLEVMLQSAAALLLLVSGLTPRAAFWLSSFHYHMATAQRRGASKLPERPAS